MAEQDIEMQILEELQKLKDIASKVREAESVYRNSSELLTKTAKQYSDLAILKDELNTNANTTRESLQKNFLLWEQTNTKKMDYLNEELVKLRINFPKDVSPQLHEVNEYVQKANTNLNSISGELTRLKKKQEAITIYICIGLFLIAIIGFIVLFFK